MTWLGVVAALALLALTPAYLKHALHGSTRPHPISWGIWATLGVLGTAATAAAHAGPAVLVLGATAVVQVAVFVVALRGDTGRIVLRELWPLAPAVVGVLVWLFASSPVAGSVGVVVADVCGLVPTLSKTWALPYTEPPALWAAGAVAFAMGCCSVSHPAVATLLYPVYLVVGNLLVAGTSWAGRRRDGLVLADSRVGA